MNTSDKIVAPSFVTVISPSGEIKILSSPRGPYMVNHLVSRFTSSFKDSALNDADEPMRF